MKPPPLLRSVLAIVALTAFLPISIAQNPLPARGKGAAPVRNTIVSVVTKEQDSTLERIAQDTSIHPEHREAIEDVLSQFPSSCVSKIRNFYVRYDHPQERGLAGKDTVILSGNVKMEEFRALLVHEMGHVTDLGCLAGTVAKGQSAFRDGGDLIFKDDPSVFFYMLSWTGEKTKRADAASGDFVSGYANTSDTFEDVAESVTFAFFHRDEFRRMAKDNPVLEKKLAWIDTYVFPKRETVAFSAYRWSASAIPWDTTKLPYVWTSVSR